MSRAQREAGKRWIGEQLSALAAAQGVTLTRLVWRIDLDGTQWVEVHTAHATLREGFRAQDLEALLADFGLKARVENRLAAAIAQLGPRDIHAVMQ